MWDGGEATVSPSAGMCSGNIKPCAATSCVNLGQESGDEAPAEPRRGRLTAVSAAFATLPAWTPHPDGPGAPWPTSWTGSPTCPGRADRLTPPRGAPAAGRRMAADWPAWVTDEVADGVRRRAAWTGRGGTRSRPPTPPTHGQPRGARHRHRLRQVAGLPAAGAHGAAREPRAARRARRHRAVRRADQGARPGPARRPGRARARRPGDHPRRRQPAGAARLDPRPRGVRPDQPRHAAPLAAARPRPLGVVLRVAALRRGRRVPPLPRRVRRPRLPRAAPAAPDLCVVRRPPDVRARLGDGGASRPRPRSG